jgi:hypothetical protein
MLNLGCAGQFKIFNSFRWLFGLDRIIWGWLELISRIWLNFLIRHFEVQVHVNLCYWCKINKKFCCLVSGTLELWKIWSRNWLTFMGGSYAPWSYFGSWFVVDIYCSHFNVCVFQPFGSALQNLQQRTWLIHWSLFVFFNHPKGRDLIIDMFIYQPL